MTHQKELRGKVQKALRQLIEDVDKQTTREWAIHKKTVKLLRIFQDERNKVLDEVMGLEEMKDEQTFDTEPNQLVKNVNTYHRAKNALRNNLRKAISRLREGEKGGK